MVRQVLPAAEKIAGNPEAWPETVGAGIYSERNLWGIAFQLVWADEAAGRIAAVEIAVPVAVAIVAVA